MGWKLVAPNGEVELFSNLELDALYVDQGNLTGGRRVLNNAGLDFLAQKMGGTTVDVSLNAEVPAPVVEFFDNRRAQLAA